MECHYNFCMKCTIKDTHEEDYPKTKVIFACVQIHSPMKSAHLGNSNLDDEVIDMEIDNDAKA